MCVRVLTLWLGRDRVYCLGVTEKGARPKGKVELTRTDLPRGQGAAAIHAFGYADMAALFGVSPWDVAAEVVDGHLEPMSFVELAYARQHGLEALRVLTESKTVLSRRPRLTHDVCTVYLPALERPYGLSDLWGYTSHDLAAVGDLRMENIHKAATLRRVDIYSLASAVDYATTMLPERLLGKLRLALPN